MIWCGGRTCGPWGSAGASAGCAQGRARAAVVLSRGGGCGTASWRRALGARGGEGGFGAAGGVGRAGILAGADLAWQRASEQWIRGKGGGNE